VPTRALAMQVIRKLGSESVEPHFSYWGPEHQMDRESGMPFGI
jgi:hypothetical protein